MHRKDRFYFYLLFYLLVPAFEYVRLNALSPDESAGGFENLLLSGIQTGIRFGILLAFFIQDLRFYYFSPVWFFPGFLFLINDWPFTINPGDDKWIFLLLLELLLILFVKKNLFGNADCWFVLLFGILHEWMDLIVFLIIACLCGIVFELFVQKKMIPFISCMCLAWWIYEMAGYLFL